MNPGEAQQAVLDKCTPDHAGRTPLVSGRLACNACYNASVYARRAARKVQLAAEKRCEVEGCKRRGTLITYGETYLCGRHFKRAELNAFRGVASSGMAGLFMFGGVRYTKESILELAQK